MAKQRRRPTRRRDKKGGPGSGRRKPCPYCKEKVEQVDWKDVASLRRFISERGKIRSRRITGACRRHQNQVSRAAAGGVTAIATARTAETMPQAILTQDVETLGERGTVVDVSAGYLRNYLIPRKLAQPASKGALEAAQQRRAAAEKAEREAKARAQENAALLGRTVLTIAQQAGDDGRLFGSVTAQDIADAIRDARGIKVDKRKIHLEDPIRHIGTHMVVVEVEDGVHATIKTMVVEQK